MYIKKYNGTKIIEDMIDDRYSARIKNGKGTKTIEDMIEDRYSGCI